MPKVGYRFTPEQRGRLSVSHLGQKAWNTGTGGCKRGHAPELYKKLPSGVYVCLGCKRENGFKYREANRKRINLQNRVDRYSISVEDFEAFFQKQNGCCAVCSVPIDKARCRIDHDHQSGKVRGLLCTSCNTGIGLLKDSLVILENAARYLRDNDEKRIDCSFAQTAPTPD